jgi:rare lipoprotein A
MKKQVIFLCFLLALLPSMISAQARKTRPKTTQIPPLQYGVASFYHNKFEGRKTSNGDIFSQKKLTAASNTLPLNSWVKVTNLSNKRSVLVKITDRMHHNNQRLIDLSRAAASKLAYIGKGLTRVKVEYLGTRKPAEELATK